MSGFITRIEHLDKSEDMAYDGAILRFLKTVKIHAAFTLIGQVLNPKALYFNFKYFPFSTAIRLPVYVSFRTRLTAVKGQVIIHAPLRTGMIRIGFGNVGIFDKKKLRAIWESNGTVHFGGGANIKFGSKISVGEGADLYLGDGFRISPNSSIVCFKKIKIGKDVRVSWDSILMDTDFHKIVDLKGKVINHPKPIIIGDNVWIGMRVSIMKGAQIKNNIIVGAKSHLNKRIEESNCIIGGNPAKVIKREVSWRP